MPVVAAEGSTEAAGASLAAWDFGPARITPLRLKNNEVFAVETQSGRYTLRLHRPGYRTPEQTHSELVFLDALGQGGGLRVPRPVQTRSRELVSRVPDDPRGRHCDLLVWLDGSQRRPGRRPGLGAIGCRRLGELIGRIHAFSARFAPPEGFDLPRWDAEGLFTEHSPHRPGSVEDLFPTRDDLALFREVERRTRAAFAMLGETRVIHADVIFGNVVWRGHQPGLLDFDDCGWGHFLYDLAPLVGNLMDYPSYRRLRAALLEGYRSAFDLAPAHEALLETLVAARHATSCLWAAGNARHGGGLTTQDAQAHIAHRLGEMRRAIGEAEQAA